MLSINKKVKFSLLAGCATFVISSMAAAPLANAQSFGNGIIDAAESGNVSQVFTLVGMGQDVNATGRFGVTALHRAAYNDAVDVGQALIESGASINPKDAGGATPLHIAARMGNVDFIQLLAKNGVDINSRDNEGFTALQRAVASDNSTAAVTLVAFGADANIANNAGQTALSTATERNDQVVLRAINARTAAATGVKAPARSDVIAVPVAHVAEGEVSHIEPELNKPVIITARHDTAPANHFNSNLELKQDAPMLQLPADSAPVPATIAVSAPVVSSPVNSNLPKSMQSNYSGHSAVTTPVLTPVAAIPAAPVAAVPVEPIQVIQPEVSDVAVISSEPVATTSWNASSESQLAQIQAPGYNNVINLDRSAEGVRANGILVSQNPAAVNSATPVTAPEVIEPVAPIAPAPLTVIDNTSAASPSVEVETLAAPTAEAPAYVAPIASQPVIDEKKALDPKLPKSMQQRSSFNEAETAPAQPDVQNIQPVIAPTVPVEGLEKQPIVKQETVTIKSPENEILKQETTITNFDAAPIAPLAPVVPASQVQKPSSEFIAPPAANPLESRVETLINEPLQFDKYNTGNPTASPQTLGYNETLEQLEKRRADANNNAAIGAATVGVAAGAVGVAAINAANDDWGGLSDSDIDRLDNEIKNKSSVKKTAAKKTAKAKKAVEAKTSELNEADLASISAEPSNKTIEEALNKQFDETKTEAAAQAKLPDEKQSDAGKASLVATNKNKVAEVAQVSEEELKAPEVPAEIAAPALPSFDKPVESNINKDVPKPEAEVKAPELPKLPEVKAESKVETAKASDALSDKDFESKLKSIDAKAAAAPKKEEFTLNESVSSSELEAQENKTAQKSVFDDIKKMSEEAAKAEIFAIIGTFPNTDAANKHYNNIAGKTGLVFPYKVSKSSADSKTYLQIGPVEDIRITDEICASFAVESKTCRVPSISDEDKKFLKDLKAVNTKNVYSLIGDFATEKQAKEFYEKVSTEKSVNYKYSVTKTSKSGVFGLQVGPLVSGGESKDVCDAFKTDDKNCVVSVK